MIKLMELIDQTLANTKLWKQEKHWNQFNKATDKGKDVLVVLKKDKKKHYVWQRGTSSSISITDLDGKKHMTIKPTDVHQVVELPHTGYVNKHPELKKYGFR
tara:strand:- start:574 stop:879 length:306 start_codon:yes stop_codon:yes gene_type:complete